MYSGVFNIQTSLFRGLKLGTPYIRQFGLGNEDRASICFQRL